MDAAAIVAIAALAVTCAVGFARVIRQMSRIEFRMDLVWSDYLRRTGAHGPHRHEDDAP